MKNLEHWLSLPHQVKKDQSHEHKMLNKLKNFRSLGPDAILVSLAPKGNEADISPEAVFLIIFTTARTV